MGPRRLGGRGIREAARSRVLRGLVGPGRRQGAGVVREVGGTRSDQQQGAIQEAGRSGQARDLAVQARPAQVPGQPRSRQTIPGGCRSPEETGQAPAGGSRSGGEDSCGALGKTGQGRFAMTVNARSGRHGDKYEQLLRRERLILDVTELLAGALEDSDLTRAELARRLGRTPGFVSQVLGGGRNLTLRTIADIAAALSLRPSFRLSSHRRSVPQSKQETRQWTPRSRPVTRMDHGVDSSPRSWRCAKSPAVEAAA